MFTGSHLDTEILTHLTPESVQGHATMMPLEINYMLAKTQLVLEDRSFFFKDNCYTAI